MAQVEAKDPPFPPSPYTSPLPSNSEPEGPTFFEKVWRHRGKIALAAAVGGFACFAYYRYHVCPPSQYLVKTGLGIKDMAVARKTLQLPFQEVKNSGLVSLSSGLFDLFVITATHLVDDVPRRFDGP